MTTARHVFLLLGAIASASQTTDARELRHHDRHRDDTQGEIRDRELLARRPAQVTGLAPTVELLIRGCQQEASELKDWPLDSLARIVEPSDGQRGALESMQTVLVGTSQSLLSACPKDVPAAVTERLDALDHVLDAFGAGLDTVRPALATFYALLNDEQKARLVVASYLSGSSPQISGFATNDSAFAVAATVQQDPICQRWTSAMREWPIRQIEAAIPLSDVQHAALYEATAVIYRAVDGAVAACPAHSSFTPLGQIDAKRRRVNALRQAIGLVRPALAHFIEALPDAQRTRLAELLNTTRVPEDPPDGGAREKGADRGAGAHLRAIKVSR